MSNERLQEQAERVLLECEICWEAMRIPRGKTDEMKNELEQHLREALDDGKPVESVVGDDTVAFAGAWGEPYRLRQSRWMEVAEQVAYVFTGTAFTLAIQHLWHRSYEIPFAPWKITLDLIRGNAVAIVGNFYLRQYVKRSENPADLEELSWEKFFVFSSAVASGYAALLATNLVVQGGDRSALSEWSWRATLASGLVGAVLLWLARDKLEAS